MALFSLRNLFLQTRHPVGLDVGFLVGPFVYFHTSCVRTAMVLVRLRGCAGSPEPSLVACAIHVSTIIFMSWLISLYRHLLPFWWGNATVPDPVHAQDSGGMLKSFRETFKLSLKRFFWPHWELLNRHSSPSQLRKLQKNMHAVQLCSLQDL